MFTTGPLKTVRSRVRYSAAKTAVPRDIPPRTCGDNLGGPAEIQARQKSEKDIRADAADLPPRKAWTAQLIPSFAVGSPAREALMEESEGVEG